MKFIKTDKHYMAEPDFEIDHYKDASYPPVASHYHEFYEIFLFVNRILIGSSDFRPFYRITAFFFLAAAGGLAVLSPPTWRH